MPVSASPIKACCGLAVPYGGHVRSSLYCKCGFHSDVLIPRLRGFCRLLRHLMCETSNITGFRGACTTDYAFCPLFFAQNLFGQLFHTSRFIRLWFSSYVHMTFAPVFLEILRSASAETISFSTCHVLIFWSVMVSDLLIVRTRLCHLELRFCTKLLQFCLGSSNYGLVRQSRSHPSDVLSNGYYAVWDSAMLRMLALLHGSTLKAIFWLPLSDQHSIASGHNEILSITDLVAAFTQ